MKRIHVIGIGAGDPEQLTLQAVRAIGETDVFFLLDKGEEKADLVDLRTRVLAEHARPGHRVAVGRDPRRDRTAPTRRYPGAVDDWRRRRAEVCEALIARELADGECGAFLVWGDPSLYDSTAAILREVRRRGAQDFAWTVIPGISSVATLAARHRTGLNQVGGPVHITTGRRLAEGGLPDGTDDVVVMLDARRAYGPLAGQGLHIYWGAYLGTADEILIAGELDDALAARITAVRGEARARKGWIMDTYLLRREGDRADAAGTAATADTADTADAVDGTGPADRAGTAGPADPAAAPGSG